jgi:tripartite-type tricarboxylate transporter receptor subunit TctC
MITKRRLIASATSLLVSAPFIARAQAKFPSESIKWIVPRAPGGGTDILARLLQPNLEKKLGQPIIVDNRPDAAAIVGAIAVKGAKPDGHTLYAADNSYYQNPAILDSIPFDTLKDFTAITMLGRSPPILYVHPSVQASNVAELVALAKKTKLTFASGGVGASTHLAGVMFNLRTGVDIQHIPFKGTGPALAALLGGHVSMQWGGISSAVPYIKDGKVRPIALTGGKRDPNVPDVATLHEQGVKDADVFSVWGLHAPAGTPIEVRRTIRNAIVEVAKDPEVAKKLVERGYEMILNTPEEHEIETARQVNLWIEVGKKVNLKE